MMLSRPTFNWDLINLYTITDTVIKLQCRQNNFNTKFYWSIEYKLMYSVSSWEIMLIIFVTAEIPQTNPN